MNRSTPTENVCFCRGSGGSGLGSSQILVHVDFDAFDRDRGQCKVHPTQARMREGQAKMLILGDVPLRPEARTNDYRLLPHGPLRCLGYLCSGVAKLCNKVLKLFGIQVSIHFDLHGGC